MPALGRHRESSTDAEEINAEPVPQRDAVGNGIRGPFDATGLGRDSSPAAK
jgi:hypothetical protein